MDDKVEVKLYVYDLTKGLARSLSPMLLGRQIDGVWHTGVVVYGEEFFYGGGMGIQSCRPMLAWICPSERATSPIGGMSERDVGLGTQQRGGTILGEPTEIVSLGQSELPYDIFLSYLEELSLSSFRGDRYHLFNHNCNTFSNEVAHFLTGRNIPSHITNLPQEVLQTPFGAMIKPFVDAMSVSPEGGHALFNSNGNSGMEAESASASSPRLPATESSTSKTVAGQDIASNIKVPPPVTYSDNTVLEEFSTQRSSLVNVLCPMDMQLVDEVNEYLSVKGVRDWSLGLAHLKALCRLIDDVDIAVGTRQLLASLLQMSLLSDDLISACVHDPDASFANLVRDHERFSDSLLVVMAKCVCNCVSFGPGAEWFISLSPDPSSSSSSPLIAVLCNSWLLGSDINVRCVAGHIIGTTVQNVKSLSAELAMDFGIPLLEACKHPASESVEYLWYALCTCIKANSMLAELLTAVDLDVDEQERNFPIISDYAREIRRLIPTDT